MPEPDRRSKFSGLPTPVRRLRPPQIHACRSGTGPEGQVSIHPANLDAAGQTSRIGPRGQVAIRPAEARLPPAPRPFRRFPAPAPRSVLRDRSVIAGRSSDRSFGTDPPISRLDGPHRSVLGDRSGDSSAGPKAPPSKPSGRLRRFLRRPLGLQAPNRRPWIGPSGQVGVPSAIQRRAARMAATTSGPSERPSHSASANTPCHSNISSPSWTRAPAASARSSRPPAGRG